MIEGRFPAPPTGHTSTVERISPRIARVTWVTGCLALSAALQVFHNLSLL